MREKIRSEIENSRIRSIVTNPSFPEASQVIKEIATSGFYDNHWVQILPRLGTDQRQVIDRISNEQAIMRDQRMFVSPDKKWIAKEKWANPFLRKLMQTALGYDAMYGDLPFEEKSKRLGQSLMHEMSIAKEVEAIVGSQECREIIQRYGFQSISLVPVAGGFIDKQTGTRTMFYPYIEANQLMDLMKYLYSKGQAEWSDFELIEQMCTELKIEFFNSGIIPYDLSATNMLVIKGKIYLFDIEFMIKRDDTHDLQEILDKA